jgi:hypothetical protein
MICSICQIDKDIESFAFRYKSTSKRHKHCRNCQKEKRRRWYLENREIVKKQSNDYYHNHPEQIAIYRNSIDSKFSQYRSLAKRRNISFLLTKDQFATFWQKPCYYGGNKPGHEIETIGIDRIDSSKGYSIENCVPCCFRCNIAKNDMNIQDFFQWVRGIQDSRG